MITIAPASQVQARSAEDWALIDQIAHGDRHAFETLYKKYYPYLFRFVYRVTRRLDLVEDVINEVMLVVWQKAASTKPLARASTWIVGIAHFKALQAVRPRGGQAEVTTSDPDEMTERRWDERSSALNEFETDNLFVRALGFLSPEQRAVLELVYYYGMHYSEIATLLDISENTVKTRVFHARHKLRAAWPALAGSPVGRD